MTTPVTPGVTPGGTPGGTPAGTPTGVTLVFRSLALSASICGFGLLLGSVSSDAAGAAFYKCVNADGGVTYSTSTCPANEQVAKIIQMGVSREALDCRIARNFTRQVAPMVVGGASADAAFNRHGGINALTPTTIGLINYLYSFKNAPEASAARISNLAISRCENGSFGPTDCAQFPPGFVEELGGCKGALVLGGTRHDATASRLDRREAAFADPPQDTRLPAAASPAGFRQTRQQQGETGDDCRARLKSQIGKLNRTMRNASSIIQQDSLRAQRHTLSRQMTKCPR